MDLVYLGNDEKYSVTRQKGERTGKGVGEEVA